MINRRLTLLASLFCLSLLMLVNVNRVNADRPIHSTASGTGSFSPATGYFFGPGTDPKFGGLIFNGTLALEPAGDEFPGLFNFENAGRGTDAETLQETMHEDGSTLSTRYEGSVQLIPEFDDDGNPTGRFTARWNGEWEIVKGTGKFRGATGGFTVTAINDPFFQTDANWNFSWSWEGDIYLPNKSRRHSPAVLRLSTRGMGSFDPANLGKGDPAIGFPFIIGDGSGEGIYDGTPRGQVKFNGLRFGPDQHFGTAQSTSPGFVSPLGTIWYPGETGLNPDGSGRKIHVMKTILGDIWLENHYYFELDPAAGTITGRADFRVVGGTWLFWRSTGSVFVLVKSDLADVTGLPDNPVAPFVYDFKGYVELFSRNRK